MSLLKPGFMRRLTVLVIVVLASSLSAQTLDKIPAAAAEKIRAMIAEKETRSPAQKKMSSHLIFGKKMKHGQPIAAGIDRLAIDLRSDAAGRTLVDIHASVTKDLLRAIVNGGGEVLHASAQAKQIHAALPLDNIEDIAGRPDVGFVTEAVEATTNRVARAPFKPESQVTNISAGVTAHRVAAARATYGATGFGVKVGVMSDSVDNLAAVQATGDLGNVTVLPGQDGLGYSGEGTAMLEIVHDLAPQAELYFATAFNGVGSFADNIRALQAAGCQIIVDDIFYYNESPFQDAPIAQAVNDVTANGVLYFSSAGNEGSVLRGTSGVWEGNFVDSGTTVGALSGVHLFSSGATTANSDQITNNGGHMALFWSDPLGASSNDYDLYIFDSSLTILRVASTTVQNGTQDPFEIVGSSSFLTNDRVVIVKKPGALSRYLHLTANRGSLALATTGQTKGHSTALDAFGVAAVAVAQAGGGSFTSPNRVEPFSSDGPRRIFYNANGSIANTGNLSLLADGGIIRNKPDISAGDGVATAAPGFNPFYGTSAAAPHAAAIAALIKQAIPAATPAQVRAALIATSIDIENIGSDITTGSGIVMADSVLSSLGATTGLPALALNTFTATPMLGGPILDPGDPASLVINLSNTAGSTAAVLTGTLTSSTPGVSINTGVSAYANIAAGSSGSNTTPFTFTIGSSVLCGTTLHFTLTTTYTGGSRAFNFNVPTGAPAAGLPVTTFYTGPAVPIPDGLAANVPGTTAVALLAVSGFTGTITDLNFRFDGTTCTSAAGATTVGLDHSYVGDLVVMLTSPSGTTVPLISRMGSGGTGGKNFCNTVLDDSGATTIGSAGDLAAPYTGIYKGAALLSAFNNEDPNGTWTLRATDFYNGDVGNIRAFSLIVTATSATCCPIITLSPSSLPAGNVGTTYATTLITAAGGVGPYTFSVTSGMLPTGVTLMPNGFLMGTPTVQNTFNFTVAALDAFGCVGSKSYSIVVGASGVIVSSFNPILGGPNTRVIITGSGFAGATSVTFNGTSASSFTLDGPTQITAIVPAGATTGPIGVTATLGTGASSSPFTILPQVSRTFVSAKRGSDSNLCTVALPCRGFARALDYTLYGGEVVVLDSGGYGPATITKAVTIYAPEAVYAGVTATSGPGMVISPTTAGDRIALEGLTLNSIGAATGITVGAGSDLSLERLVINNFSGQAIQLSAGTSLRAAKLTVRGSGGVLNLGGTALITDSRFEDGSLGVSTTSPGKTTVRHCSFTRMTKAFQGNAAGSATSQTQIERCSITGGGIGISGDGGIFSPVNYRVNRSTIVGNSTGIAGGNFTNVYSLGNNTVEGNSTNGTFSSMIPLK